MTSPEIAARQRVGIYGGTFAPPHNAHVRAAIAFLEAARLDVLYIVPAAVPPHKTLTPGDDPALRLAMTHAAFDNVDPRIRVSDYEIESAGVSYTYRTLTHFSEVCGGELFLLCGTDMFLTLDTWRYPEKIFALAAIACMMRQHDPAVYDAVAAKEDEYRRRFGARTLQIPAQPMELSSSLVRQMVQEGKDVSALVPSAVYRIIGMHNLYRSDCV